MNETTAATVEKNPAGMDRLASSGSYRRIIIAGIVAGLLASAALVVWTGSRFQIVRGGNSRAGTFHTFHVTGLDSITPTTSFGMYTCQARQWFRNREVVFMCGCVGPSVFGIETIPGNRTKSGAPEFEAFFEVGTPGPRATHIPQMKATLEFDAEAGKVTLTNTGAVLPWDTDKIYLVQVNEAFQITGFTAEDPRKPPAAWPRTLAADYLLFMRTRYPDIAVPMG